MPILKEPIFIDKKQPLNLPTGDFRSYEGGCSVANGKVIEKLINVLTYKKGWEFVINRNTTANLSYLCVRINTVDSRQSNAHELSPVEQRTQYVGSDRFYEYNEYHYRIEEPFFIVHSIAIQEFPFRDVEEAERWLFDQIVNVETHEAMEFFKIEGEAPFFPHSDNPLKDTPYKIKRKDDAN